MYCDVFTNIHGTGDLLFIEAGNRRQFAFLDPPVQSRYRFWLTIELNCLTRPFELIDFQFLIIRQVVERGHCIVDLPREWVQAWKAEYDERHQSADAQDNNLQEGTASATPEFEYIPPPRKPGADPGWA